MLCNTPLDLDSAFWREHPTPYLQPPPASKDIKQEDFDINPDDYRSDQPRCIKVPGQLAPGRLLPSKKEIIVSIPYPLDPVKGTSPSKEGFYWSKKIQGKVGSLLLQKLSWLKLCSSYLAIG